MAEHVKRDEIGQNVFYNKISNPAVLNSRPAQTNNINAFEFLDGIFGGEPPLDKAGIASLLSNLSDLSDLSDIAGESGLELANGEKINNFEDFEDFEEYESGEEIKNILQLNNYFNSDEYKMSKVEYDFNSSGSISRMENGSLEIKYDESELTGFDGAYSQILFNPKTKNIVTVRRKSFFDVWFTLEKGKRISVGETGRYAGTVHTTVTRELVNNMTANGGEMSVVYITESNGYPYEMISHTIRAERVRK
jgi:hypothetical protein